MKKIVLLLIVLASPFARAEYTFDYIALEAADIELQDIFDDGSNIDLEGNGFAIEFLKELEERIVVGGGFSTLEADYSNPAGKIETSGTSFSIGIGKWFEIGTNAKFIPSVLLSRTDVEVKVNSTAGSAKASDDDTDMSLEGDFIVALSESIDALVGLSVDEDDASYGAGLSADVTSQLSLEVAFSGGEDWESFGLRARFKLD